jgi:hypothetical protein
MVKHLNVDVESHLHDQYKNIQNTSNCKAIITVVDEEANPKILLCGSLSELRKHFLLHISHSLLFFFHVQNNTFHGMSVTVMVVLHFLSLLKNCGILLAFGT